MNDNDALEQLRIVYTEAKLASMSEDCGSPDSEMVFFARIGLEKTINELNFEQLDKLMVELIELNGEVEHEKD
tara:strand:- start:2345 stop:2563 length:219 start_codon:yes stop_codon:yes gene_type:complete